MKKYKWCPAVCRCGARMQAVITKVETPEPWVSIYPCENCAHPETAEQNRRMWEESDRKLAEMIARGEVLDCNGNPVPNIRVVQ